MSARSEPRGGAIAVAAAGVLALAALAASLALGRRAMTLETIARVLWAPDEGLDSVIVWDVRLPRALLALAAGASLATAGAMMQGVLRNALASPDLTGVIGGGALAVAVALAWFDPPPLLLPVAGLIGGIVAAALCLHLAWSRGLDPARMALAGVTVAAMAAAATTAVLITAGPQVETLYFWLVGGLLGRTWPHLWLQAPWAMLGLALAWSARRPLDLMALGDESATALGVGLAAWRIMALGAAVVLAAGVVAVAGPIAFVGLAAPHIARLFVGHRHARLLPAAAIIGGALLVSADLAARTLAVREIPVGFVTALLGGPLFIALAARLGR